jgi:hypothetical protein
MTITDFICTLFGVIFLAAIIVYIAWVFYVYHHPGKNWVTTEGIVYVCRINTKRDSNNDEFCEPIIKCLYKVKGVPYTLNLKGKVYWMSTQYEWGNIALYYPSGYTTIVRYDPKHPKRALVDTKASERYQVLGQPNDSTSK